MAHEVLFIEGVGQCGKHPHEQMEMFTETLLGRRKHDPRSNLGQTPEQQERIRPLWQDWKGTGLDFNFGEDAAADAAAMDAAGNDTEEEKQNDDLPPLEDLDEDPPKLANPNFTKWHKPCRDPEQVRDHWETFVNQVKRAAWYRAMISFLVKNSAPHGLTTFDEARVPHI